MISLTSTGTELRRFRRGTLPKLALGALVLIPLLYGALYLWAFWDPTGRMDNLPVALVVQDEGATISGEHREAGTEIATRLTDSGDLRWVRTDADDARTGVEDGDYYFAVTIPADFSQRIADVAGDDPTAASIAVTYNDANSFLATTLGRSAMEQVQTAVREEIGAQAVDSVLVGLGEARDGLGKASDGALRLTTAAGTVSDGAHTLADGVQSAATGASTLASGLGELRAGAGSASDGVARLDAGASRLADGAATLSGGSSTLASGTSKLATGASTLKTGASSLADGASTLSDGTQKVSAGATSLSSGATTLAEGATTLATGVTTAHEGSVTLADGASRLAAGAATASSGADALASGFTRADGLVAGAAALADGADELADGLEAAAPTLAEVPATLSDIAELLTANVRTLTALDPDGTSTTVQAVIAQDRAALTQLGGIDGASIAAQLDAAVTGSRTLADGAAALSSGVTTASDGAQQLAAQLRPGTQGTTTLRDGIDGVAAGAAGLEQGLGQLSTGAGSVASGAGSLATGAGSLADGASSAAQGAATLTQGASKVATGARDLAQGATGASAGASKLAKGAGSLASGASTLADGTSTLADGTSALLAGATSAAEGASTLADGTAQLADGAGRLDDGTTQLADGAGTLADGLADGAAQIPDDSETLRTQRADVIAAPVVVTDSDVAQAEGFGEGFAPFFISLALFVGALITWLLLRPVPSRALAAPVSGARIAWAGLWPALIVGVGQVVVMLSVVKLGLGMHTAHFAGVVAFTLLVSAAFIALQQAIIALAGPAAGKVVVLAILMLQLASSGGTYPVPVTADFFQAIHPWLPMSYAVTGLRQLITGGVDGRLLVSVAVLGGTLVASLAVTAWRSGRMRTWTVDRLHPAISL
mgnify:CR=1 FL=1